MTPKTRTGEVTYDEFCWRIGDDQKADLIEGVIYMASPENTDANELFVWLIGLIALFVEELGLGNVYGSRVALRLSDRNAPEPDILYLHRDRLNSVQRGCIAGPCDVAIEIVSPESVERDYELKRKLYQQFGIREYWIIDEHEQVVRFLRLDADGRYQDVALKDGEYRSDALPGFWFRPEWLWQQPRPRKLSLVQQILARVTTKE